MQNTTSSSSEIQISYSLYLRDRIFVIFIHFVYIFFYKGATSYKYNHSGHGWVDATSLEIVLYHINNFARNDVVWIFSGTGLNIARKPAVRHSPVHFKFSIETWKTISRNLNVDDESITALIALNVFTIMGRVKSSTPLSGKHCAVHSLCRSEWFLKAYTINIETLGVLVCCAVILPHKHANQNVRALNQQELLGKL